MMQPQRLHPQRLKEAMPQTGPLKQPSAARAILFSLLILGGFALLDTFIQLARLARNAWLHPVLFYDSQDLIRPGDQWGAGLIGWLFAQHNEHRIVLQRLSSLIGEAWLDMPPAAGGVPSSVLILLAISGCIAWLCRLLIRPGLSAWCTWLICTLLAWHPWQIENLVWEFQTPWFVISLLVLLSTALQIEVSRGSIPLWMSRGFCAVAPLLAILSNGQGLAAAFSMSAAAAVSDRRGGILALGSTVIGAVVMFGFGYQKPAYHPPYGFNLTYLFNILTNSLPDGRGLVLLILLVLAAWTVPLAMGRSELLISCQPIVFVVLFALMTTISRSGFGPDQALASRYSTYSALILINLLLLMISRSAEQPRLQVLVLAMSLILTVPVSGTFSNQWPTTWRLVHEAYDSRVKLMECSFRSKGKECLKSNLWPDPKSAPADLNNYFSGNYTLRGWHRRLAGE
jgi:hypothetical protein